MHYASVAEEVNRHVRFIIVQSLSVGIPQNRGCTKLSKAIQTFSHDAVLNFLVREEYEPYDLFQQVKPLVLFEGGVLSVDDSIWDKPHSHARLNPLIGRHYSGRHHKLVQGICLVTLFYTDTKGVRVLVNYRIYMQDGEKAKNELFHDMLD